VCKPKQVEKYRIQNTKARKEKYHLKLEGVIQRLHWSRDSKEEKVCTKKGT